MSMLNEYIPKKDVQQEEFLQKYPSYDGRGLKIAIIDSGVDVSLPGLQKTSTGLPKIIECFDFTGAGDVDTSTIKKTTEKNNTLVLLSGREVEIPAKWQNPSQKWHLGIKPLYQICPEVKYENVNTILQNLVVEKPEVIKPKKAWNTIENKKVGDLISKEHILDCIVWNDGKIWRACLVNSFIDDLEAAKVLTNFRDSHEYCYILDEISCSVTIDDNGNLLKIFTPDSNHGTAISYTAAAHFPDDPKKDGLAPGAQIVSFKIFCHDNTNCNYIDKWKKSLLKCIEIGVDIVNLSVTTEDLCEREIAEIIKKMVQEHCIIILDSAGNDGPYYSSIYKDILVNYDHLLVVGSVYTSEMKKNIFGIEVENTDVDKPKVFPYSSKGPLIYGERGVTFSAPGAAITAKAKWNTSDIELCYGTSYAAPIASGAIACLLTALKANSIQYTPETLKMALSNTAFLPDGTNRLGFGNGIIQINSAFEYFKMFKKILPKIIFPQISLTGSNMKGIIIYKTTPNDNTFEFRVNLNHSNIPTTKKKQQWCLKHSSENYSHIDHPKIVENNLFFNVKIDTKSLKSGNIYYSEIHGFNPSNISLGPIFHLPITVIVPENVVDYCIKKELHLKPETPYNLFINPPIESHQCTIKLIDSENGMLKVCTTLMKKEIERDVKFNESENTWKMKIKWNSIFEFWIFQNLIIAEGTDLHCILEIIF